MRVLAWEQITFGVKKFLPVCNRQKLSNIAAAFRRNRGCAYLQRHHLIGNRFWQILFYVCGFCLGLERASIRRRCRQREFTTPAPVESTARSAACSLLIKEKIRSLDGLAES